MIIEFPQTFTPTITKDAALFQRNTIGAKNLQIDHTFLSLETLKEFQAWLRGKAEYRGTLTLLTSLLNILTDVRSAKVANLKLLPDAIKLFLTQTSNGWLYKNEGCYALPFLVTSAYYHIGRDREKPHVTVEFAYNAHNEFCKTTITLDSDDIIKKSVGEIFADRKLFLPTDEYESQYKNHTTLYNNWRPQIGKQFRAFGKAKTYDKREYNREEVKFTKSTRLVNDEDTATSIRLAASNQFHEHFTEVPTHSFIKLFDLSQHRHVIAHVAQLAEYTYDPQIAEKLILPSSHQRIIQTLMTDIKVNDFIEGKTGGTHVLLLGSPGRGKTTTAEVFSEIAKRPLYRIQSGQLGVTGPDVEKNLKTIFERAERWDAVCLFDEADVIIMERGTSLEQNAVVAGILRAMEYTECTAFWTSNRATIIDDAVFSRCLAIIKYGEVDTSLQIKLWETLGKQFDVPISSDLPTIFPTASGRDIKMLLQLVKRHCATHQLEPNTDAFIECAAVRGLI